MVKHGLAIPLTDRKKDVTFACYIDEKEHENNKQVIVSVAVRCCCSCRKIDCIYWILAK